MWRVIKDLAFFSDNLCYREVIKIDLPDEQRQPQNGAQLCASYKPAVFVWLSLPGAFPLTYRVAIQPEVCIRIGEG